MTAEHDASSTRPQVTSEEEPRFFSLLSDAERERIWERMLRRPERKASSSIPGAPLTDFDQTFQEVAGPKLEGYVRFGAYMVFLEVESFSEAHDRVMRVARKYGAAHLSDEAWFTLDSWIDQALARAIDLPPPEGLVTPEQLDRIRRECR